MDAIDRAVRLGQMRAAAAGLIASILALTAWGTLTPGTWYVGPISYDSLSGYQDDLRNTLIPGVVIGVATFSVVSFAWGRLVEARRFGGRRASKQSSDKWGWLLFWPCYVLVINLWRPFDTFVPPATFATFGTSDVAWTVSPAAMAWWLVLAVSVGVSLPFIAWRAMTDTAPYDEPLHAASG